MTTRATLVKLVHAGARKLFADDDTRRVWQRLRTCKSGCGATCRQPAACTGHSSCKTMGFTDLEKLVAELRRKKALDPPRAPKRAGRVPANRLDPYMTKIEALLADMGLSWQYAEAIAWRITGGKGLQPESKPGVKRLEWVRKDEHFRGIIAALEVEQKKRKHLAHIDEFLPRLGMTESDMEELIPTHLRGGKWRRHLPTLRIIVVGINQQLSQQLEEELEAQECP